MENINHEVLMQLESFIKDLIGKIDATLEYEVATNIDDQGIYISLQGENLGKLIGYHGKNLYALELLLTSVFFNMAKTHDFSFSFDINNYKKERETNLTNMAKRIADEVIRKNISVSLPPMRSAERRFIHQIIAEIEGVETESVGEGTRRKVVIKPEPIF